MHHVLDSLLDLGKGGRLTAIVQHGNHRVHAPKHLSEQLVVVGQGQAWGGCLGEGVVALVCRLFSTEGREEKTLEASSPLVVVVVCVCVSTPTCPGVVSHSACSPRPLAPAVSSEL